MDLSSLLFVLLALFIVIMFYFITIYNRLQSLRNGASATLSQIRVAMKKRLDMVEQLVDMVKSYAHFEKETLEKITSMRTGLMSADPRDMRKINSDSLSLLSDIRAVAESYPALKTSDAVVNTMNAVREVEDEISRHRYTYNNIIQELNTMIDTLPSSFIASSARLSKQEYLSFEEDELRRAGYLTSEEIEPRRPETGWQ
ncbi:MAG: LemA family protein [Methanothrix sp.]|nr:LemA family protein [Methanothrix sp.]